jgi:hypothetical protein
MFPAAESGRTSIRPSSAVASNRGSLTQRVGKALPTANRMEKNSTIFFTH